MGAAAVFTQQRAASDQFGCAEQVAQVKRLLPGEIEGASAADADLAGS